VAGRACRPWSLNRVNSLVTRSTSERNWGKMLMGIVSRGCQAARGEGLVQPEPAVPLTSAAPIVSQRAIAGKTTTAAGSATPQNTIASLIRTVSVKIDFIFLIGWMSSDLIWIQYSTIQVGIANFFFRNFSGTISLGNCVFSAGANLQSSGNSRNWTEPARTPRYGTFLTVRTRLFDPASNHHKRDVPSPHSLSDQFRIRRDYSVKRPHDATFRK